jgi:insertion element IS1 protein InsB
MVGCPKCESKSVVKNGRIHNGKQRYVCKSCGRQFVPSGSKKVVDDETKGLIDRLLLEKLSLAGIARAAKVSQTWLQSYVNVKYQEVPKVVVVSEKKGL